MHILTISGSSGTPSTNTTLLKLLPGFFPDRKFTHFEGVTNLPLYTVAADQNPLPEDVVMWREAVATSSAIVISTPAYIHNIPAVLKNALEWLTTSGEMMHKPVLAITYTPNPPRGKKAMKSLVWSLKALDSRVVAELSLYQTSLQITEGAITGIEEELEILREAINLLK